MIHTVAEFLQELIEEERTKLDALKIPHAPTIGSMYEGLSRAILDKAIPLKGLNVTSGFIRDPTGKWSRQLDCMIVVGEGEAVSHTDSRIYALDQVVAVVEVKKNLYTAGIGEGFENLRSMLALQHKTSPKIASVIRKSFQIITNSYLPVDKSSMPLLHQGIYWSLVTDTIWPVRIILGYHGFTSVETFRQGIRDHFANLEGEPDWGPAALPSCIIGPKYTAAKNIAMPWTFEIIDGWWPLIATNHTLSPVLILLEIIWSKLNLLGMLPPDFFGEDLSFEPWDRFIDARPVSKGKWEYSLWPARLPDEMMNTTQEWSPIFVGLAAHTLFGLLCSCDPEPLKLDSLQASSEEIDCGVRELEAGGIAARDPFCSNHLHLLTSECGSVMLPDGRFALGENNSGRLTRWVSNYIAARKAAKHERKVEADDLTPAPLPQP